MSEDPIARLRADLDLWNAQLRDWEASLAATQAQMLPVYEDQLALWRAQLENAAQRLRLLRASSEAEADRAREVDAALAEIAEVFQRVRSRFGPNSL